MTEKDATGTDSNNTHKNSGAMPVNTGDEDKSRPVFFLQEYPEFKIFIKGYTNEKSETLPPKAVDAGEGWVSNAAGTNSNANKKLPPKAVNTSSENSETITKPRIKITSI